MQQFFVYESVNGGAVGPFATHAEARTWKQAVIPQQDQANAHGLSAEGYRGWLVVKREKAAADEYVQWETPAECEARYAECKALGYY